MLALCLGITAFALYFIYDANSFLWRRRFPRMFFAFGTLLLGAALLLDLYSVWTAHSFTGLADIILLALSAVSFGLLIYSLFFALPFDETYAKQENGRRVYDKGAYALCRHPGILFFFGAYLFLGLAALPSAGLLVNGMLFSLLDLLYAWFQDRITFPKTFTNYRDYQQKVPFLLPTKASLQTALRTLRPAGNEEVES